MLRKILASAAMATFLAGAAQAAAPSPAGLTPGAPLGSDDITDSKVVVGERR